MHETSAPGPAHVSGTLKTGYPGRISGDIRPIWPDLGIHTGYSKSQIPASLPLRTPWDKRESLGVHWYQKDP